MKRISYLAVALGIFLYTLPAQAQSAPGTPTLVQHVATGMDSQPVTSLSIPLPNPAGAGNALILGVQFQSVGSVASVTDDQGNTWVAGPTVTGNYHQTMSLYYALNVIGGTQKITVTFSGLGSAAGLPQAVVSEFYNVAQVSALDGSSASGSSLNAGAITTTAPGDLIYHWGVDFSDHYGGGTFNGTSITAGSGFTLLSADLQVGSSDQYQVQANAGSINPAFTVSGSATWGSLALALKSANAGTPPPQGIRIVHIQHTYLSGESMPPITMQFPSSGNLLVGLYDSGDVLITGVTDNAHNTWVSAASTTGGGADTPAQIVYAANATTSPNLSGIKVTLTGTTRTDDFLVLYDITGAASSPFDIASTASGNQANQGNLTTASITPSTVNGLVLSVTSIYFHTINGTVGLGYNLDSVVNGFDDNDPLNPGGTPPSPLDEDNAYAHVYNASTGTLSFVYTYAQNGGGVEDWGSVATAFKASGATSSNYTLSVIASGNGTITSNPEGINCPGSCSASFSNGTTVTLSATPAPGDIFSGWSGGCSGPGTCTVDAAATVTGNFNLIAGKGFTFDQLTQNDVTANSNSVATTGLQSNMTAGDLLVVWLWYSSKTASVSSITDSVGDTYVKAAGPSRGAGSLASWSQELWYAKNVNAGGSGVITSATFSSSFSGEKAIAVHEYSGADTANPLDVTASAVGTTANASSGNATTTAGNDLIFGAALFASSGGPGTGFTGRSSLAGNATEDMIAANTGPNAATFASGAQNWIAQMASFKVVASPNIIYGDVNGDGAVTIADSALVGEYAVGLVTLTTAQLEAAMVSSKTETSPTIYDAFLIAEYAVGLITQFPAH